MTRRVGVWLVAVLGMLPIGAARAEEPDKEKVLQLLEFAFENREVEALARVLQPEVLQVLATDADVTCRVCSMAEDASTPMTKSADSMDDSAAVFRAITDLGTLVVKEHPKSPEAYRARAHALSAKVRHDIVLSAFDGKGPWEECAELCMKAAELSSGRTSKYMAAAVGYLMAWIPHAGERTDEALQKAVEICQRGLRSRPDDEHLEGALAGVYLRQAEQAIANRKKGDAKKAVQAAEALLKPGDDLPSGKSGDARAGRYNGVLAFAAQHKIKLKADYLLKQRKSLTWIISYPRGRGWTWSRGGEGQRDWTLTKKMGDGFVRITMDAFRWDTNYTTPDGEAGGDNTSGVMLQDMESCKELFTDVKKQRKKLSGKVNRKIRKTTGFELRGKDEDGDPLYIRGYFFKGDEHRMTFGLDVLLFGDIAEDDPEIELILEELREVEKK